MRKIIIAMMLLFTTNVFANGCYDTTTVAGLERCVSYKQLEQHAELMATVVLTMYAEFLK